MIDKPAIYMKSVAYLLMVILLIMSCQSRKSNEPVASDTEIIDLWDNGRAHKVWVYALINGKRTAIREIQYHPNGVKSMEGPLKDGLRHGEWKSWYEDGSLWSVGSFVNGLRHGKGIVYHPNGKKFIEGAYIHGERSGKWMWWDEDGRLITETEAIKMAPELVE